MTLDLEVVTQAVNLLEDESDALFRHPGISEDDAEEVDVISVGLVANQHASLPRHALLDGRGHLQETYNDNNDEDDDDDNDDDNGDDGHTHIVGFKPITIWLQVESTNHYTKVLPYICFDVNSAFFITKTLGP